MGSNPIPVANASVAQLVEQGTENPRVVGSIPTGGTIFADLAHLVERHLAKVEVAGSRPVIRSIQTGGASAHPVLYQVAFRREPRKSLWDLPRSCVQRRAAIAERVAATGFET